MIYWLCSNVGEMMKKVNDKEKKQFIVGIIIVILLAIISVILFNETSLLLCGIAIMLFAILLKLFVINKLYK